VEKEGLDQVENSSELKAVMQENFKQKIFSTLKENLMFSLMSYILGKMIDSETVDKNKFQTEFIAFWKKSINETTQRELSVINNFLNESNIDMINIINGTDVLADTEDYQRIINESIKEVEGIFWKICGKDTK
jgi:hypothetical protein